jgi:hypothetical protein
MTRGKPLKNITRSYRPFANAPIETWGRDKLQQFPDSLILIRAVAIREVRRKWRERVVFFIGDGTSVRKNPQVKGLSEMPSDRLPQHFSAEGCVLKKPCTDKVIHAIMSEVLIRSLHHKACASPAMLVPCGCPGSMLAFPCSYLIDPESSDTRLSWIFSGMSIHGNMRKDKGKRRTEGERFPPRWGD